MKATGVVRQVDNLGRAVLPKELRRTLDIEPGSSLEIFVDGEDIILRKYQPGCAFCGEVNNTKEFEGKQICNKCLEKIAGHWEEVKEMEA